MIEGLPAGETCLSLSVSLARRFGEAAYAKHIRTRRISINVSHKAEVMRGRREEEKGREGECDSMAMNHF